MRTPSLLLVAALALAASAYAESSLKNTDWLVNAGHGVFTHYLADNREANITTPDQWNALVDAFNVTALAQQLSQAGVRYHVLTIGQNSGFFIAPNPTLDQIIGRNGTTSKNSRRNLVVDLAAAYAPYGIKLCVYIPSGAPDKDPEAVAALQWANGGAETTDNFNVSTGHWTTSGLDANGMPWGMTSADDPQRLISFQTNWESVLADWSVGFGQNVHMWWVDGMYFSSHMYDFPMEDTPNFYSLAAALRAGNPSALVAFNPGQIQHTPIESCAQDITAGETASNFPTPPPRRTGECGVQYHLLTYMGTNWGQRGSVPRFSTSTIYNMTSAYVASQWALTWDMPIDDSGLIEEAFIDVVSQLTNITGNATTSFSSSRTGGKQRRRMSEAAAFWEHPVPLVTQMQADELLLHSTTLQQQRRMEEANK